MYRNHVTYQSFSDKLKQQFSKQENSLSIGNLTSIWDQNKKQLILIMDTSRLIYNEIRAYLKGNSLFLEAPLVLSYNKPYRSHLMGKENRDEIENGLTLIGFAEVKLRYGYQYQVISCQAIEPNMIKVILGFSDWDRSGNN